MADKNNLHVLDYEGGFINIDLDGLPQTSIYCTDECTFEFCPSCWFSAAQIG